MLSLLSRGCVPGRNKLRQKHLNQCVGPMSRPGLRRRRPAKNPTIMIHVECDVYSFCSSQSTRRIVVIHSIVPISKLLAMPISQRVFHRSTYLSSPNIDLPLFYLSIVIRIWVIKGVYCAPHRLWSRKVALPRIAINIAVSSTMMVMANKVIDVTKEWKLRSPLLSHLRLLPCSELFLSQLGFLTLRFL